MTKELTLVDYIAQINKFKYVKLENDELLYECIRSLTQATEEGIVDCFIALLKLVDNLPQKSDLTILKIRFDTLDTLIPLVSCVFGSYSSMHSILFTIRAFTDLFTAIRHRANSKTMETYLCFATILGLYKKFGSTGTTLENMFQQRIKGNEIV